MLNLLAKLGLDGSGFELGMKKASSQAKRFSDDLGREAGGRLKSFLTLAAAEEGIRRIINYASHVQDLSDRLGISTTALQEWQGAASQAGAKADAVAVFFEHLAVARDKALSGDSNALEAFKDFGVSGSDLATMRLQDLGLKIGNAVKEGDAQKLIASLREIGGKGAGELVATFKSGLEEGFKNTSIIPPEKIAELDALGDRFTSFGKTLIVAFSPFVIWIGKQLDNIITLAQYMGTAFSIAAKNIAHGKFSTTDEQKAELDKIITDWENRKKRKPSDNSDKGGGSPKEKQRPLVPKGFEEDFFKDATKEPRQSLNLNQLQQIGAYVALNPVQQDIRNIAIEARRIGLTVQEMLNESRRSHRIPAGFENSTQDNGRGVQF